MHKANNPSKANNPRTRRQFFRSLGGHGAIQRPPWTGDDLIERCLRCAACIEACPEGVLFSGGGGYPEIRFDAEGCTLCGACVEVCEAGVFDTQRPAFPWHARIIENRCLALAEIHCQSCQDACDWQAIDFSPQLGRPPRPRLNVEACTGCGACQAQCPNHAITMTTEEVAHVE